MEMTLPPLHGASNTGKIAGQGTNILPDAPARFLPLVTARAAVGVLALFGMRKTCR